MFGIEPEFKNAYIHVGGDSNFVGNEFSWFQRPYSDFGWLGMLVFTFIVFGFFLGIFIFALIRKKKTEEEGNTIY